MRGIVQLLSKQPNYARLLQWGRLITITGSAQIIIQGIGFVSGILVIRLLPTQDYAYYTIANTMLGTMLVLADGGIISGVLSEGGKVWHNPTKFGAVIVTGFHLRRRFTIFSLLVAVPLLYYLLSSHGASLQLSFLMIFCLVPAFFTALSGTLLEIAPKLKQEVLPLQKIQVITSLGRLILTSTCLLIFPFTWIALIATGIPQLYGNHLLKKMSKNLADYSQKPDKLVEKAILKIVKRVMPGSIYYCFSAQITIWLISMFGSTHAIAQMGALGRVGMLLTIFTVMFSTLVLPRFARLSADYHLLIRRFLQLEFALFILSGLIIGFFWLFSTQILWILGNEYRNLNVEVVLNIIGTCLSLIAGITFNLYSSRGWAINPFLSIGINICSIVTGVFLFNVATLTGILLLNIFIAGAQAIMSLTYSLIKIQQLKFQDG